ncbi:TetR family transcriptional regulator [Phenylobacterium sp. Root77]|uniref:TetR/AcrR family transcriptional regulator n=2 Tax=Phenylobacterium TaxID=20 RepID=UPI0006F76962|nr:TetR/AcrR family transcriptional regulator [Phenylobacterium sp. Root1277]KQW65570.1 TetR family transcriptional regulator [Phenylobacterium sp. Root1277]KQW95904.1 TetR family transcriptional regulator [Phenylobacterium sp. Root1290]KRC39013.1 TetR family transcriptional regulator [Phenylobacterium sp. Root77]
MSATEGRRYSLVSDLTFPPREGGYANGRDTRDTIITAAFRLLMDEGYRAITMRRVAKECGLKIGNVTYHFSSREDLVRSMFEAVSLSYQAVVTDKMPLDEDRPAQRFRDLCNFFLDDIKTRKTTMVFPELWSLSNHDEFVYDLVNALYDSARVTFFDLISELRPDLSPTLRHQLSVVVQASIEGLTVFAGYKKPFHAQMDQMEAITVKAFMDLISNIRESDVLQGDPS